MKKNKIFSLIVAFFIIFTSSFNIISFNESNQSDSQKDLNNDPSIVIEEISKPFLSSDLESLLMDPKEGDKMLSLIVKLQPQRYEMGIRFIAQIKQLTIKKYFGSFSMILVNGRVEHLRKLIQCNFIEALYQDLPSEVQVDDKMKDFMHSSSSTGEIPDISKLIGLDTLSENVNARSYSGEDVVIAILDSGIDVLGQIGGDLDDFDDNSSTIDPKLYGSTSMVSYEPLYYSDFRGSGTYHAGVAAGTGGRNLEYEGVAPDSYVLNVKVVDSLGLTYPSFVISGLAWAVNHDADIIAIPWSFPGLYNDAISLAINDLVDDGLVVVVPAGDDGPAYTSMLTPAQSLKAITVGAFNHITENAANFSSRGPTYDFRTGPDIVAPGVNIVGPRVVLEPDLSGVDNEFLGVGSSQTSIPTMDVEVPPFGTPVDENYTMVSSSSSAAAIVAGACAILLSIYPLATPELIKISLMKTAIPIISDETIGGAGLINISAAAIWLNNFTDSASIGLRVPHTQIYPGMIANSDYRNITAEDNPPDYWNYYNLYMPASTQATLPALFVVNSSFSNFSKADLHLPLNQFSLNFDDSTYMFSDLIVYRELSNVTSYNGYDPSDYCRWAGILGLDKKLFVVVVIESWSYAFDGFESLIPPKKNYTNRITAFKFNFNFINIGQESYHDFRLISFFKADLYLNENNNSDPYDIESSQNSTYDDDVIYDQSSELGYVIDQYDKGENATFEWTAMGFNSTSHEGASWEVNKSDVLFQKLMDGSKVPFNSSESLITSPNSDLGFIQSWKITDCLKPNTKANFSGIFSIGKSNISSTKAVDIMKNNIHLIQTNVTHPDIIDMAIITTEADRMSIIDTTYEATTYIINIGNRKVDNTEFWLIVNHTTGSNQIAFYTAVNIIKNWDVMDILKFNFDWIPNKLGSYQLIWLLGGYTLITSPDDSLYNNYLSRTLFIYNKTKLEQNLADLVYITPTRFPVKPFIITHPGDVALINFTIISATTIDDLRLRILDSHSSIINLDSHHYSGLEKHSKIPMTLIVPQFYKSGIYLLNLDFIFNEDQFQISIPIIFQLEDYKGRILFDGYHNQIIQDTSVSNVSLSGMRIETLLKERLDTIFGSYYQFRKLLSKITPRGMAMTQIIPGMDSSGMMESQLDLTSMGSEESFALDLLFKGDNFFQFDNSSNPDEITYDLIKFFDCVIISDPEKPLSSDEIKNLTRYMNLGGRVLVLAENRTENDLDSLNQLLKVGNLNINGQHKGTRKITYIKNNYEYLVELVDPMVINKNSDEGLNVTQINSYMAHSKVGEGYIIAIGDEDFITEEYIPKYNNSHFTRDFLQNLLNNSLEISIEITNNTIKRGEKVYISFNLQNLEDTNKIEEDFLGLLGFVNERAEAINASLYGFELPVFPLLETNSTARYGYYDSLWSSNENNDTYIVFYLDTPSTLSETYSFKVHVYGEYAPSEIEEFSLNPDYPLWIDIIFLAILISQIVLLWGYSSRKWQSRHKYIELTEEKKNLIKNALSSLQSEIDQMDSGIKAKKLNELEKLRFILRREEDLEIILKEIEKLGGEMGEK